MNTLPPNFHQHFSRAEVQQSFSEDSNFSAHAATVLYFKLVELSQQHQILQSQFDSLLQRHFNLQEAYDTLWELHMAEVGEATTTVDLPPFLQRNRN